MTSTLVVSRNTLAGSTLAGRVMISDDGKTLFLPGDNSEDFDAFLNMVEKGVLQTSTRTFVEPGAGETYLDAVVEMFARSTQWTVVRRG